jgi:predicted acetyltransferase
MKFVGVTLKQLLEEYSEMYLYFIILTADDKQPNSRSSIQKHVACDIIFLSCYEILKRKKRNKYIRNTKTPFTLTKDED